jgi:hypothetical protein
MLFREQNFFHVAYIGAGFVIMFTAYLATQNVASQAMRNFGFENIGFYSVACVYGSYSITSLFCSPLVKKLGAKYSLCLASACFTIWIATFILPALQYDKIQEGKTVEELPFVLKTGFINAMIILASIIGGAGNSIIWVAHGCYISECASESNKGAFNGFFWIILQAAMIIGNSLGSVLDENLG